jgi:alpha-tubulin suppressor-like RCC1 family protein
MDSFELIYPNLSSGCTNVLLIDNSVMDSQIFYNSVNENTFPIIYSKTSLKTKLLEVLKQFTNINRIGIVFTYPVVHFLDNKSFFDNENVEFIKSVINEFRITNIDYLACNTLNDSNWVNYYNQISETGVVVGASNDRTGNIKYGGDWVMESTGQDIELIYFTKSIEYYTYLLDGSYWGVISFKSDGSIWGIGSNNTGQLGTGDTNERTVLTQINTNMIDRRPVALCCGVYSTFVLTLNGTIWATGLNSNGQLGTGDTTQCTILTQMNTSMVSGKPIAISTCGFQRAGRESTLVLTTNSIWGTGINFYGELGIAQGDTTQRNLLTQMNTTMLDGTPIAISCGDDYTIVMTATGIWGTGNNSSGQLGIAQGDTTQRTVLTQMDTSMLVGSLVAISSSGSSTIVLTSNGIWGTGNNGSGELGIAQGDTTQRTVLTQMDTSMLIGSVLAISRGNSHTIVLTSNGSIWGTGSNGSGQLGIAQGDTTQRSLLTQMNTTMLDGTPIAISCGENRTIVLTSNGTIWGTGSNENGGTSFGNILTKLTTNNSNFVYLTGMKFTLPLSDICFPAGTPVDTDQGIVAIDHLKPGVHTINGQVVVDITKTITTDKHLVEFKKDALCPNCPSAPVRVSKEHKLFYNGNMYAAKTFVANFDAEFVPYYGEPLYNVLLEEQSTMTINGLICETLHPDNLIAKLYTKKCKLDVLTRDHYAASLLECLKTQDIEGYNRIAQLC